MKLQIGLILRPEQLFKKWLDIPILCNIWDEKRLMNLSRAIHWSQTSYFWAVLSNPNHIFDEFFNYFFSFYLNRIASSEIQSCGSWRWQCWKSSSNRSWNFLWWKVRFEMNYFSTIWFPQKIWLKKAKIWFDELFDVLLFFTGSLEKQNQEPLCIWNPKVWSLAKLNL